MNRKNSMNRFGVCILVATIAGCAGQPQHPAAAAPQPQPVVASAQAPVTRQVPVDASNVAEVQKAGYKVVNKNGDKLYCRTDPITGSRTQTRTQCLTEQELYDQMHQTQNAMSTITTQQTPTGFTLNGR
jgi:hypothetical protein